MDVGTSTHDHTHDVSERDEGGEGGLCRADESCYGTRVAMEAAWAPNMYLPPTPYMRVRWRAGPPTAGAIAPACPYTQVAATGSVDRVSWTLQFWSLISRVSTEQSVVINPQARSTSCSYRRKSSWMGLVLTGSMLRLAVGRAWSAADRRIQNGMSNSGHAQDGDSAIMMCAGTPCSLCCAVRGSVVHARPALPTH